MFGSVLIAVITGMHVYIFWRCASVPCVKYHLPTKFVIAAGVVTWLLFYSGRVYGHNGTGILARALKMAGMNWMAAVFLIFVCLLPLDVMSGFGLLFPRHAPSLRGLAIATGMVLSVIALIQGLRPPVVDNYDVCLSDLPIEMENTVIVAMSDLHLGPLIGERWLNARVAQVNAEQPDIVVVLGDIFEGHGQPEDTLIQAMNRLSAPMGVWAVYGNHSHYRRGNAGMSLTQEARFKFLCNRWTELRPGFTLAGVDDLTALRHSGKNDDFISRAVSGRPKGAAILLSHTPWETEKAAKAGIGLMLCGHTHGGQIWPFDYLVKRRYPLLEGRYEVNGMTVIVCRGTGTWGPRMRLWSPGEILRVTLHGKRG